jgi:hypothetical protein
VIRRRERVRRELVVAPIRVHGSDDDAVLEHERAIE